MAGRAFDTTVLESMATNIASSSPDKASSTWRCDICPAVSAEVIVVVADTDVDLDSSLEDVVDDINRCSPQLIPVAKSRQPAGVGSGRSPLRAGRGLGSPAGRVSALGL